MAVPAALYNPSYYAPVNNNRKPAGPAVQNAGERPKLQNRWESEHHSQYHSDGWVSEKDISWISKDVGTACCASQRHHPGSLFGVYYPSSAPATHPTDLPQSRPQPCHQASPHLVQPVLMPQPHPASPALAKRDFIQQTEAPRPFLRMHHDGQKVPFRFYRPDTRSCNKGVSADPLEGRCRPRSSSPHHNSTVTVKVDRKALYTPTLLNRKLREESRFIPKRQSELRRSHHCHREVPMADFCCGCADHTLAATHPSSNGASLQTQTFPCGDGQHVTFTGANAEGNHVSSSVEPPGQQPTSAIAAIGLPPSVRAIPQDKRCDPRLYKGLPPSFTHFIQPAGKQSVPPRCTRVTVEDCLHIYD